jgi:hypothetical protein
MIGGKHEVSDYPGKAVDPKTGHVESVMYLDNYYGRHRYGVRFPDGNVYPEHEIEHRGPERDGQGS